MGYTAKTKCLDCSWIFLECYGGGFTFHKVRCDQCGKTKDIGFDELKGLHERCYGGETEGHGKDLQKNTPAEPISEEEYHRGVDAMAGKCNCGGGYTLNAPPRCPKCRSARVQEEKDGIEVCYD